MLHEFFKGFRVGLPVAFAYLPYGLAYALIAKNAGLSLFQILLMSLVVYAGTSQFLIVAMMSQYQPLTSILISVFIINSRYLLINSALSTHMKGWSRINKSLVGYYVSDETFVVLNKSAENKVLTPKFALGVNTVALVGWLVSNVIGFSAGDSIQLKEFGFDFALIAVLIALAAMMIKKQLTLMVGLSSALFSVTLHYLGYEKISILVASLLAASAGVITLWIQKKST